MNRIEMAEQIASRVPILAERDHKEWRETEERRRKFVADYTLRKIAQMRRDDFVIGKGSGNRSLCYRLERELDKCGRILGAPASKFGVYYGKTKSDRRERYRHAAHWGNSYSQAFDSIKAALVQLLDAARIGDLAAIKEYKIFPMFKGKLLFLYYPHKFAPIYSKHHLEHFVSELNLPGTFDFEVAMQQALMEYRSTWPELTS